jgi:hypothetical protein
MRAKRLCRNYHLCHSFCASEARRRACPVLVTGESSIFSRFWMPALRRHDDDYITSCYYNTVSKAGIQAGCWIMSGMIIGRHLIVRGISFGHLSTGKIV